MHSWGDDWEGWDDLYAAEKVLWFYGKKLGNIDGYIKEKWGSLRWSASIRAPHSLHDIVKAGHVAYRWSPDRHPFLCLLDNFSKSYMCLFSYAFFRYRKFMYGFAYHMACRKYPKVKPEILEDTEWPELLFKSEKKIVDAMRAGTRDEDEDGDQQETT